MTCKLWDQRRQKISMVTLLQTDLIQLGRPKSTQVDLFNPTRRSSHNLWPLRNPYSRTETILSECRRCVIAKRRMSYFVVGLTNEDPASTPPVYKQYRYVQYDATLPPSGEASVNFPPSGDTYRYVVIHRQFRRIQAICIAEVRVFVRRKFMKILPIYHYW